MTTQITKLQEEIQKKQRERQKQLIEDQIRKLQENITKQQESKDQFNKMQEPIIIKNIELKDNKSENKSEVNDKALLLINLLKQAKKSKEDTDMPPMKININDTNIEIENINIMDKQNNKSENIIIIESNKYTESEGYNDYIVELEDEITCNMIDIKIDIPLNNINNITNENNQIVIIYENNEIIFELEDNMYNRYEICEYLNEGFSMHNLNIECTFDELYYSITHKNNKNFTIIQNDNSILRDLGFNKNNYSNKSNYTAEQSLNIGDNIYYIEFDDIFKFKIINDKVIKQYESLDFEYKAKELIIKIKKTPNAIITNCKQYN